MQSITIPSPQKPKITIIDDQTAKFEIEGCYPGYGTTLGNSLRRVLLSSLGGAAITSVKIKGASHEFSNIPNVLEDVIQIILNLKGVRFKLHKDESVKVQLKAKGEKVVTAGMIICPADIEVVNKEAHIATITSPKGELEMELEIGSGIGYVPVEQQKRAEKEIGVIAVDAIYTPVRRVNYTVDNMRVGKKTDYEKITLEVSTDGSILPEEAFLRSVNILIEQFSNLSEIQEKDTEKEEVKAVKEETKKEAKKEEKTDDIEESESINVTTLKSLSTRTLNVLEKNKVATVGDIVKFNEAQLKELEGMGDKGIKEIKKSIGEFGLNLKQEK
jgi:DNA-directed RNA polymerase subunit alpha